MSVRIGLISDTHIPEACDALWPQVFDAFAGVDAILHGGDIHTLTVIDQLQQVAPVYVARGNGDDGSGGRTTLPDDVRLREVWQLEFEGVRVGLTHYVPMPESPPHLTVTRWVDKLFPDARPHVLVYGDTHVEQVQYFDDVLVVNPGSPTFPHNLNTQLGTVGFLDIDDGQVQASIWQIAEHGLETFDWQRWGRPW